MKKLYTLLLAAAVTLSAAAAAPLQSLRQATAPVNPVQFKEYNTKANATIDVEKLSSTLAKAEAEVSSRAVEYPSFDRKYMLLSTQTPEATVVDAAPCHLYEDPDAPGAGLFYLENFIMQNTNKIECTFDPQDVQGTTYMFLTIPSGTVLFSQNGMDYKLRFLAYDSEGNPGLYTDDIEFVLFPNGQLVYPYENCGIAYITDNYYGSWICDPTMVEINGSYKSEDMSDYNASTGQATYSTFECDVYGEYSSEYGMLLIANFDGYGSTISGVVDLDAKTVSVPSQYITSFRPYQTEQIWADAHIAGLSSSATTLDPMLLELASVDGKTKVTGEGALLVVPANEELNALYPNDGWNKLQLFSDLYDIEITLDFEIPGLASSGIEETVVSDENAPVVYYNLQGVRVENHSNGLYIKRQGNKATKVLVK